MADKTRIEWSEATWNPVTGCDEVSPGCARCYAKAFAERWRGTPGHPYEQGFDLRLWPERLDQPLRWRRSRLIFVNSMSDLFHDDVPDEFVAEVFAVMQLAHWHTFQALTKRPERMVALLGDHEFLCKVDGARERLRPGSGDFDWPAPNVWLGVSIENRRFVHRADVLRETPAAVRFISAEPLLGPLVAPWFKLDVTLGGETSTSGRSWAWEDGYRGPALELAGIDWLIAGGESGPGARPMRGEWARDLRDACLASRCPSCMGEPIMRCTVCGGADNHPSWAKAGPALCTSACTRGLDGAVLRTPHVIEACVQCGGDGRGTRFFLKQLGGWPDKRGGEAAVLDGRTWTEMPRAAVAA